MESYEEFKGDLTCPVTVKLNDEFKIRYGKMKPEANKDDYAEDDRCVECKKPFMSAGVSYAYSIKSFDKNVSVKLDKKYDWSRFCCKECAQKFFEKLYPGVFVTESDNEYFARLRAGRKKLGQETAADKFVSKSLGRMAAQQQKIAEAQQKFAAKKKGGLLSLLFPFLK